MSPPPSSDAPSTLKSHIDALLSARRRGGAKPAAERRAGGWPNAPDDDWAEDAQGRSAAGNETTASRDAESPATEPLDAADAGERPWRIAVLSTRWNQDVVDCMREDAVNRLLAGGVSDANIPLWQVPGAFELPQAAMALARPGGGLAAEVDAIVALGVVIRGETAHFQFVADTCAQGLSRVALDTGVPVTLGVLTTDNRKQAEKRAGFPRHRSEPERLGLRNLARRIALGTRKPEDYVRAIAESISQARGAPAAGHDKLPKPTKGWEVAGAALDLLGLSVGPSTPLFRTRR